MTSPKNGVFQTLPHKKALLRYRAHAHDDTRMNKRGLYAMTCLSRPTKCNHDCDKRWIFFNASVRAGDSAVGARQSIISARHFCAFQSFCKPSPPPLFFARPLHKPGMLGGRSVLTGTGHFLGIFFLQVRTYSQEQQLCC